MGKMDKLTLYYIYILYNLWVFLTKNPDYGKILPVERYSEYHSSEVRRISAALQSSAIRSGVEVPVTTCVNAGWRSIHANAIAEGVQSYFCAKRSSSAFSAGNFSFPRNVPSKKPYCKGDQACIKIPFARQYSIASPARVTDSSLYIFTLNPASTGAV